MKTTTLTKKKQRNTQIVFLEFGHVFVRKFAYVEKKQYFCGINHSRIPILIIVHIRRDGMAKSSRDYLDEYNKLPSASRKRVMRALKEWGGWTKTSVYRKLQCPNLSPIEKILIEGVMEQAIAKQHDGQQLEICFEWDKHAGFVIR